jgi:uncharacterized protein (TIGR00251 family)
MDRFVKVKVKASSARESIFVERTNQLHIAVKEPADGNLANERVIALVAAHFQVEKKQVRIISGHHRPQKMLRITSA